MFNLFNKNDKYIKEKEQIEHNLKEVKKALTDNQQAFIAISIGSVLPNDASEKNKSDIIQYLVNIAHNLNILNEECSKYINFMVNHDKNYFLELIKECNTVSNDIEETMISLKSTYDMINKRLD